MDMYRDYFPTKAYRHAEMRLSALLLAERDRLDALAKALGRESAIGLDNLSEQMPEIIAFTKAFHENFARYLAAVLPQQPRPIQCRAACGNCCHHYPMPDDTRHEITFLIRIGHSLLIDYSLSRGREIAPNRIQALFDLSDFLHRYWGASIALHTTFTLANTEVTTELLRQDL